MNVLIEKLEKNMERQFSFPLLSTGDWFQDLRGYQNPWLLKSLLYEMVQYSWPSVSSGSASGVTEG